MTEKTLELWLLTASTLVALSVLLVPAAARMRAPILLVFLFLGIALGHDGPGGIDFNNYVLAFHIGSLALALILLSGGLETRLRAIGPVGGKAAVLASGGVILTMLLLGAGAYLFTRYSFLEALLIGAVLSATDAAATFMVLGHSGITLKHRLGEILTAESGFNDPLSIVLTIILSAVLANGGSAPAFSVALLSEALAKALGFGLLGGFIGGFAIPMILNRLRLSGGLASVFVLSAALAVFAAVKAAGGSGYLAIYLCGLLTRARMRASLRSTLALHDAMGWLAQIVLFLMLGLLVKPHDFPAALPGGLAVAILLTFFARPLATAVCLAPFGVPWRDRLFLGWVGLRGAVPIVLTLIPMARPSPVTKELFNLVFIVVLTSLLLQGWTIPFAARILKVGVTKDHAP